MSIPRNRMPIRYAIAVILTVLAVPALAQEAPPSVKDAKNPFADLINLQFFYDVYPGVAPANNTQQVLTLQPLIPIHLNSDWIIITRTIRCSRLCTSFAMLSRAIFLRKS